MFIKITQRYMGKPSKRSPVSHKCVGNAHWFSLSLSPLLPPASLYSCLLLGVHFMAKLG